MKRSKRTSFPMFKPYPDADARKRSVVALVKYLLANRDPDIMLRHRRALLSVLLWKITEAESPKYKTRFRSRAAVDCSDTRKLHHDHVFQRKNMVERLVKAKSREVEAILKKAMGCTITREEHKRLTEFTKYDGWVRYRKASVVVIDTKTNA